MENDTLLLYEDIAQGAHMGIAAIEELMKRTEDARFQAELERTRSDYQYILDQAEEQIAARGEKPKELSMVTRMNTWGMVTAATIFDHSNANLSKLMLKGMEMADKGFNDKLADYPGADERSRRLADRLTELQNRHRSVYKKYLN